MNIPGYQIESELGRGGMATVYKAVQQSLHRAVALKIMAPALAADANFGERFLREARTAASLNHPGIMSIYDVGVEGHNYYIAMEYVPGGDLKQKLHQGVIAPAEALSLISQVAQALGHAHAKGFVHRDVKPENILFREDNTPVLADFGIAKAIGSGTKMTGTGMSIGTPHYMSPEQARGQQVDGRSDLYSLGIVLYEILTGKAPFEAEDSFAIAYAHINNPIPRLSDNLSTLQPLLDNLLEKKTADRYLDANALLADIDKINQGQPLTTKAQPQPQSQPQSKTQVMPATPPPEKQRSAVVWLLVGALLAAALGGGFWYIQQQNVPHIVSSGGNQLNRPSVTHKPDKQQDKQHIQQQPQLTPEQKKEQQIARLIKAAEQDIQALRLTKPAGNNALEKYQQIQKFDPNNQKAQQGFETLVEHYVALSDKALNQKNFSKSSNYLKIARDIIPENAKALQISLRLAEVTKDQEEQQQVEAQRIASLREQRRQTEPHLPAIIVDPTTGMDFVLVEGGCFQMGDEKGARDEKPVHVVCVNTFYMGKYEVTQAQWREIMGDNPAAFKGDMRPVETVSWGSVNEFVKKMNNRSGSIYRLPTEAEWEYAARGGIGWETAGNSIASYVAWYDKNSNGRTSEVGKKTANTLGINDMIGNVWEWCTDSWHKNYVGAPNNGTAWNDDTIEKFVLRGGAFDSLENSLRVSGRYKMNKKMKNHSTGFRLIVEI